MPDLLKIGTCDCHNVILLCYPHYTVTYVVHPAEIERKTGTVIAQAARVTHRRFGNLRQFLNPVRWLVHPYGKVKVKWDLMVAVLIVYSTLSVPFRIGFEETAGLFGMVVDAVVDVGFTLDIALSFRTAFLDEVMNSDVFAFRVLYNPLADDSNRS